MADPADNPPPEPSSPQTLDRLDSWKEIAAYLRRGVTTVQRWEKEEGLPTHRLHHGKLGSVYAYRGELDGWVRDRRERIEREGEAAGDHPSAAAAFEPTPPVRPARRESRGWVALVPWLGLTGAGLVAAFLTVSRLVSSPAPTASPGAAYAYPITSSRSLERHPALSPDGRQVAYVSNEAGETFDLYVKEVDSPAVLRLTTSAASECCPAWSPDQRSLAFLRLVENEAVLLTMPTMGGAAERRVSLTPWFGSGLSFSPDGRLLAYSDRSAPGGPFVVKLLELATGEVRPLTRVSPDFSGDAFPRFSPDGRYVALARLGASKDVGTADVYVVPVEGGEPRRLTRDEGFLGDVDWTPDSREVLFLSDRTHALRLSRVAVSGGEPALVWPGGDPITTNTVAEALMDVSHAFRFSAAP